LRYGGRKVHEIICTNRPVPNGTLGGVRGSDDTYSIEAKALFCAIAGYPVDCYHESRLKL
uniref:hypothetical protein n=1 Tax=Faecalibaculum rodentium TaxID=1702221 RepID=UPI0023F3C090